MFKRTIKNTITYVLDSFSVYHVAFYQEKRCILDGEKKLDTEKSYFISMGIGTYIGAIKMRDLTIENMLRYVLDSCALYHVGFFRKRKCASQMGKETNVSQNFVTQWHANSINRSDFLFSIKKTKVTLFVSNATMLTLKAENTRDRMMITQA